LSVLTRIETERIRKQNNQVNFMDERIIARKLLNLLSAFEFLSKARYTLTKCVVTPRTLSFLPVDASPSLVLRNPTEDKHSQRRASITSPLFRSLFFSGSTRRQMRSSEKLEGEGEERRRKKRRKTEAESFIFLPFQTCSISLNRDDNAIVMRGISASRKRREGDDRARTATLGPSVSVRDLNLQTIPIMSHVTISPVSRHSYESTRGVGETRCNRPQRSVTPRLLDTQRLRAVVANYATSKATPSPSHPPPPLALIYKRRCLDRQCLHAAAVKVLSGLR